MKKYSVDVRIHSTDASYREFRFQADTTHECVQFIERVAEPHELTNWDYFKRNGELIVHMYDEENESPIYGTANIHRTCIVVLD